jgi:hypothetical protein
MCEHEFPAVKGRVADHSPPASAVVKNMWRFATIPIHPFQGVHKKGFIFIFYNLLGTFGINLL